MNIEDSDIAYAEIDSNRERARQYAGTAGLERAYTDRHPTSPSHLEGDQPHQREEVEVLESPREEVERLPSSSHHDGRHGSMVSSISSSSSSSFSSVAHESLRPGNGTRQRPSRVGSTLTQTATSAEEAKLMAFLDRHPTAIQRMQEHRLQHVGTVGSRKPGTIDEAELPDFGGNKPYPPALPAQEEYVVEFNGHDDPHHPQNWKTSRKLLISGILIFFAIAATFASSVFSSASTAIEQEFGMGRETVTLGTSLFVLGYATGPLIFAPMSELYGRRLPLIIAAFAFGVFNIAVAVAKDFQTLVLGRFFAGLFGSCPLTVVAAVFSDMYNNEHRGVAVASFSATIICGPFSGPFIGGFITKSYLGWRWTAYIPAFMGFASMVLIFFFQEESYGPVILVEKAKYLRRLTRNWGIHAKQEEVEVDFKELVTKNISRPLRILFTEPIVLLVTIYMSFIYGLLYLNLTAYTLVFGEVYGWSLGVSGLPYLAMIVGVMIGFITIVFMNKGYVKKLKANDNIPVPEWRMPLPMVGGIIFAMGLFWFGWGGYMASTPWIVPTLAGLFIGFGIYSVFLQCLNYIIDAYLMFAASAIAANTIMRSIFGAVFPLFGYYMFEGIGINWGMTLLGCVAVIFIPMPFLFYFKGKTIRAKSKFAPAPDIQKEKEERRDEESSVGGNNGGEEGSRNGSRSGSGSGTRSSPGEEEKKME